MIKHNVRKTRPLINWPFSVVEGQLFFFFFRWFLVYQRATANKMALCDYQQAQGLVQGDGKFKELRQDLRQRS